MKNPPPGVKLVMAAVCVMMEIKPDRIPDPSGSGKMVRFMSEISLFFLESTHNKWIKTRAVKVSALIDAINVAAINALKYFNAINATLFTSGVRCPLTRNRRVPT